MRVCLLQSHCVRWPIALCAFFWLICAGIKASAWPLDVSIASELRVIPRLDADRRRVWLDLRLRDDHDSPLGDRAVSIEARLDGVGITVPSVRTNAMGEATVSVPVTASSRLLTIEAVSSASRGVAGSSARVEVALDAPYVTAELLLGAGVLERGGPPIDAVLSVDTGQVISLAPGNLPVDITAVEHGAYRAVAAGVTNTSGRAVLSLGWESFPQPGVVRLVPRVELAPGRVREGPARDLLVRAQTVVSIVRVGEAATATGVVELRGSLRMVPDGPVPGASVLVVDGDGPVAGARTNEEGEFSVRLPAETALRPGLTVRAKFDPTEPWWVASVSRAIVIGPVPSPTVPWRWMAAPLLLALLVLPVVQVLSWRRAGSPEVAMRPTPVSEFREGILAVKADTESLELTSRVVDVSTGRVVGAAEMSLSEGVWHPASATLKGLVLGPKRMLFRAPGYALRSIDVTVPRSGRHVVHVALTSWREAVFGTVRPMLRRKAMGPALPTPREALSGDGAHTLEWRSWIEESVYGPEDPNAETLDHAVALSGKEPE